MSNMSFKEYIESITEVLCNTYGYAISKASAAVNEFSDFLPVCFKDGWSVAYCAKMISVEMQVCAVNGTINFSEYTSRIEKLLHDTYGFSSLNAKIAIICSSDFLPKCYVDGWSAAFVAQMLSVEV